MAPDTTMGAAGLIAAGARTMLIRKNTLINYGFVEEYINVYGTPSIRHASQMFQHVEDKVTVNFNDKVNVEDKSNVNNNISHSYKKF